MDTLDEEKRLLEHCKLFSANGWKSNFSNMADSHIWKVFYRSFAIYKTNYNWRICVCVILVVIEMPWIENEKSNQCVTLNSEHGQHHTPNLLQPTTRKCCGSATAIQSAKSCCTFREKSHNNEYSSITRNTSTTTDQSVAKPTCHLYSSLEPVMSGAHWFPAAGSDPDTWGISAGLLAQRKQLPDNAAACKRKTRKVFTWMRTAVEEIGQIKIITSNNCTHYTIVELPRGAALSLRQTQETLRSLGGCAYLTAAGPMEICADETPPGCSQWKNPKMPSCLWIRPLNVSMAATSTSPPTAVRLCSIHKLCAAATSPVLTIHR